MERGKEMKEGEKERKENEGKGNGSRGRGHMDADADVVVKAKVMVEDLGKSGAVRFGGLVHDLIDLI
ncbi:hypothetical protein RhiirC2_783671 [Rhizophagus irregularis]|uniref:Uncharacterized protein n=1 Tax=Rhizophagus irregularis TaxID=588596 RepID=A0A2N1N0C2_9GLOM|nr:hypothetical protein RhiirC2_783671 [Rhizophagus irregularis]